MASVQIQEDVEDVTDLRVDSSDEVGGLERGFVTRMCIVQSVCVLAGEATILSCASFSPLLTSPDAVLVAFPAGAAPASDTRRPDGTTVA